MWDRMLAPALVVLFLVSLGSCIAIVMWDDGEEHACRDSVRHLSGGRYPTAPFLTDQNVDCNRP